MNISIKEIQSLLGEIKDPEIPVLSIIDLGVVRDVRLKNDVTEIDITPTYSGCPAMKVIEDEIISILKQNGIDNVKMKTVYSPAWTTDWINDDAKERLRTYGIAPPTRNIHCPRCGSANFELISQFGSTPCKALYRCRDCREPFDYFKCH